MLPEERAVCRRFFGNAFCSVPFRQTDHRRLSAAWKGAEMADINVERRGPTIWAWIIGLIILVLLIWAIAEIVDRESTPNRETIEVVPQPGTYSAPAPTTTPNNTAPAAVPTTPAPATVPDTIR